MNEGKPENVFEEKQRELVDLVDKYGGREFVEPDGFVFVEVNDPQDFLEAIAEGGDYLFSGSSKRTVGQLDPASSVSALSAIYMTRNPVLAMFHGLVGGMDNKLSRENRITMEIDDYTGKISYPVAEFSVGNQDAISNEGFVYIIKNGLKYTRNDNGEYLSSDPVKPDLVLKFKRDAFPFEINVPDEKNEKNTYAYHVDDKGGEVDIYLEVDNKDIEKINRLVDLFSEFSDNEFKNYLAKIKEESPNFMRRLIGIKQTSLHSGIDVYDHTFNTYDHLDTSENTPDEKIVLRMSLYLHDIGKIGAESREHARESAKMVRDILKKTKLNEEIKLQIENQIRYHDFLGDLSRDDREHRIYQEEQLKSIFKTREEFQIHKQISIADISSIPGLASNTPRIEKKYSELIDTYYQAGV